MTRGCKLIGLVLGTALLGALGMGAADAEPPAIQIDTPRDGASYLLNEPVQVAWSVRDVAGSGVKSVLATQANGEQLNTGVAGDHAFSVRAEDNAGNQAQERARYWVVYDVAVERPLGPSAFEGDTPPSMTVSAGAEIPFSFKVRDFFEQPVHNASGTISVLDAETGEIVYLGEDGVGVLHFDPETSTYDYALSTDPLAANEYQVLVQFNDGRSIFRVDLTLESSASS